MLRREEATKTLITVALTATIDATGACVWRAIVDPAERLRWDDRILGEVHFRTATRHESRTRRVPLPDRPGGTIRATAWRIRFGDVPLVMLEEIHREEPYERLCGRISIGSMRFDHVLTVHEERDASGPHTHLGMKLVAGNSIAVIGEVVPRSEVQRIVLGYVDGTLRQIRKHCETFGHPSVSPNPSSGPTPGPFPDPAPIRRD
jgi:hypothetical protein